jgi:hypothetical protein
MASVIDFVSMLEAVHLQGVNEECVVTISNDEASVMAMDMTSSLYVQAKAQFEHEDDQFGIGDLALFIKYLNSYSGVEVDFTRSDNKLKIKPKGSSVTNYLLSEVDLIPTYDSDWEGDDKANECIEEYSGKATALRADNVSEFLNLMRLFSPNSINLKVDKKGAISVHGGNKTEHQFDIPLGKSKCGVCNMKVYGPHFVAVLGAIDFEKQPIIYIQDEQPITIVSGDYAWILSPLDNDE